MPQVESQRLQVAYWQIEKLIPFARNPRAHSEEQINQIAASIREFGWTNPILIDPESQTSRRERLRRCLLTADVGL